MKIWRCEDIRAADQKAQELGIAGIVLMEHAAIALAKVVIEASKSYGRRIAIICGCGNNGGDGYALARLLKQNDALQVTIVKNHEIDNLSGDAKTNAEIAVRLGIPMITSEQLSADGYDILVDCLFGSGLSRAIVGENAHLIEQLNNFDAYRIACDIPSGLSADEGLIQGCAFQAHETVTFGGGKLGLYMNDGITHSGTITIADIGIPPQVMNEYESIVILDDDIIQQRLPHRTINSHKRTYGNLLLIGGKKGMHGALCMASEASLRCGAGLVTMMGEELHCGSAFALQEAMCLNYPKLDSEAFQKQLLHFDCVAVGNGLGRDERAMWLIQQVWNSDLPAVFDGDALYLLGQWPKRKSRTAPYVLTPHPKELSYLLGVDTKDLLKNPSEALKLSEKTFSNGVVVLKNARTLISDGSARYLNLTGNHGLATGGSGDILCGMILGLMGQGSSGMDAAACAVYLHGKCADSLSKTMATRSILPRDLLRQLPKELMSFDIE